MLIESLGCKSRDGRLFAIIECIYTQCGNSSILLPARFYVKSIFENPKMQKVLLLTISRGLYSCNWINFVLQKVWKFKDFTATQILREIKFGNFKSSKIATLATSTALNFDF